MIWTWHYVDPDPYGAGGQVYAVATGGGLAVAGSSAASYSTDGKNWLTHLGGSNPFGATRINALATDGTYVVAGGGVRPFTIGVSHGLGSWALQGPIAGGVGALLNTAPGVFWGGMAAAGFGGAPGGIYVSTDGGYTWSITGAFGGSANACWSLSASSTLMAGMGDLSGGIVKCVYSTNGGSAWSYTATLPFSITSGAPTVDVVGNRLIVCDGNSGQVGYSDDLGNTWAVVSIPGVIQQQGSAALRSAVLSGAITSMHSGLIAVSNEGAGWSLPASQPFSDGNCFGFAVLGNVAIAVGNDNTSTHTIAWAYMSAPPTRQYPRDDNLALGAVRQSGRSTSLQNSIRQGSAGTYS